jgi:hypothetical protein
MLLKQRTATSLKVFTIQYCMDCDLLNENRTGSYKIAHLAKYTPRFNNLLTFALDVHENLPLNTSVGCIYNNK